MKRSLGLSTLAIVGTLVSLLFSCSQHQRESTHRPKFQSEGDIVAIPLFTSVDSGARDQIRAWLKGYLNLNQALIVDRLAGAKTAATDLLTKTNKVDMSRLSEEQMDFYFIQSSRLKTDLLIISQSTDIEQARSGLAGVSEAMYALVKAFRVNTDPLYYQYCPMARNNQGATWLSATEELANPYMGQMMLNCGRTQEKLE